MKNSIVIILLLAFLGLTSCNSNANSFNERELVKEIEQRIDAFIEYNNELDATALKSFYSDDERFYWVEDGKIQYPNKEVLSASLEGLVNMVSTSNMKIINRKVQVISATSAMIFLEYEQAMTMSSGRAFSIDGAMTVLFQKEEGVWRFLIGHSSTKKERG